MSKKRIYVEGGGKGSAWDSAVREGFKQLFSRAGLPESSYQIIPSESRGEAINKFNIALNSGKYEYVALLVDSDAPVADNDKPIEHLATQTDCSNPDTSDNTQVFLMTTCMEAWIIADLETLKSHFDRNFLSGRLQSLGGIEARSSDEIEKLLKEATRPCRNGYQKNPKSFELLGKLSPDPLTQKLPAFARMLRILHEKL